MSRSENARRVTMVDFIIYILKSAFVLGILYLLYFILFRKETFYHYNRMYILGAMVVSMIIPALNIQLYQPVIYAENNFDYVSHVFLGFSETIEYVKTTTTEKVESFPLIGYLLLSGIIIAMIRVGFQIVIIFANIKKYKVKTDGKYTYVLIDQHHSTHSFFNYIFVQKTEFKKKRIKEVLLHEQAHADQGHSIDLLLIGFMSVLQWFNPFIYLFKRALVETHEFQADQAVIAKGVEKNHYQRLLLEHARSVVMTGLTSSFNQSIIKNRLKMMNKTKSSNSMIIKYAIAFPVVFFVGIFFAISQEKIDDSIVQVINVSNQGEMITGTSDFAIVEMPEDNRINVYADHFYDASAVVRMDGNVKMETIDKRIKIQADHIMINKEERKLYAYSDDYVPSISPIADKDLKRISSGFGMRKHPITKENKMHNGIDFSASQGTPILCSANGVVRTSEYGKDYGNRVIIDHGNGYSTSYSQMEKYIVEPGQSVQKGEVLGYVGSTGLSTAPHLHYEVMKDGEYVDPEGYLGKGAK